MNRIAVKIGQPRNREAFEVRPKTERSRVCRELKHITAAAFNNTISQRTVSLQRLHEAFSTNSPLSLTKVVTDNPLQFVNHYPGEGCAARFSAEALGVIFEKARGIPAIVKSYCAQCIRVKSRWTLATAPFPSGCCSLSPPQETSSSL
jgi:hypothetical protein